MAQSYDSQGNAFWYDDSQFDAAGNPVKSQFDTWLGTVSGNAPMQPKVKNYLSGLQTNYGLTTDDFNNALKSYGATYSDGGFLNDKNVGWWGEDAMLRAFGTGLDTLNPNAAYKGSWQSMYSKQAEDAQQKDFATRFAANEANQGSDLADLKDIALGASAVLGVGALGGAFGGLGAASGGAAAAEGGMSLAPGAFEGLSSALVPAGANVVPAGLTAVGGGAAIPASSGILGALTGGAAGAVTGAADGWTSGADLPTGGATGGTGGNNVSWLDDLLNEAPTGWENTQTGDPLAGLFDNVTPPVDQVGSDWASGNPTGPVGGSNATTTPSWLSQIKNAPTSLLKSAFGLNDADAASMSSLLGKLAGAGLGAYASNQQANALADVAKQYAEYGAPYRAELGRLQSDPGSFLSSPRVTTAVDQGTSAMARALSARDGNPVGSGRALQEMQNYATNSLYGQLTNRENQLANFGGLSSYNNSAPQANLAAVGQTGNMYNAIGAGINDIFNPQPTYLDLVKAMKGLA